MFETRFRKLAVVGLTLFMVFMVACSAPAAEVVETAVAPTTIPATNVPPTDASVTAVAIPQKTGTISTGEITSPALANNLIGDSNTKSYRVYLPPSYDTSDKRYPVVYFLHGNTEDETTHVAPVRDTLNEMIANGDALEMIIVFPNTKTAFLGIGLYDSPTTGDYPTYLSHDLVNHIDANFRTIPHRDSRGIAGCGDGTTNVLNLAFTHPDIFSVPVAMTGIYNYENHKIVWQMPTDAFEGMPADFAEIEAELAQFWPALALMNLAAGAAPNPDNPPFYLDMPLEMVDGQAQIVPEVAAKINAADPTHLLQTYLDQPLRFRGMLVYQKTQQELMPVESARAFDTLLTQQGVAHEYIEASGGNVAPYFCDNELAIQFMAEHLSFEMPE